MMAPAAKKASATAPEPKKEETKEPEVAAPASAPLETAQQPDPAGTGASVEPETAVHVAPTKEQPEPRWETVKKTVYGREVVELHMIGFVGPGFEFNLSDLPEIRSLLKKLS